MNSDKRLELFYKSKYEEAHKNLCCDPSVCPWCLEDILKQAGLCDSSFLMEDVPEQHVEL